MSFFDKLKQGLSKTQKNIAESINNTFSSFRKVDEELLDELEENLIAADLGMDASVELISRLRTRIKQEKIEEVEKIKEILKEEIIKILDIEYNELNLSTKPTVILIIGVNGVGKTTSIGKIANNLRQSGKKIVVAAADTFRAAAVEQLEIWCTRADVEIIKKEEGIDPASVVYEAIDKAKQTNADVLICDTAGRLHNKSHLMEELAKINRVINKGLPESSIETLLVLDATTGQNMIMQASAFSEIANITGFILTKLDGTAKGGAVIGVVDKTKIPVKFIGVGEQIDDMQKFDVENFVDAII